MTTKRSITAAALALLGVPLLLAGVLAAAAIPDYT